MSQDYWEPFMGVHMAYWNDFAKDSTNMSIKPKLSDENGHPIVGNTCDEGGYHYKVKSYVSKKGEPYYKVIRSTPGTNNAQTPPSVVNNNFYEDGAKRGHEENLKAWDEQTKAILVLAQVLSKTNEYLEILARNAVKQELKGGDKA